MSVNECAKSVSLLGRPWWRRRNKRPKLVCKRPAMCVDFMLVCWSIQNLPWKQHVLFGHVWMEWAGFSLKVDVFVLPDATARCFRFLCFLFESSLAMFWKTRHILLSYNNYFLHLRLAVSHRWDVPFTVTTSATTRRAVEFFHPTRPPKPPRLSDGPKSANHRDPIATKPPKKKPKFQRWNPLVGQ